MWLHQRYPLVEGWCLAVCCANLADEKTVSDRLEAKQCVELEEQNSSCICLWHVPIPLIKALSQTLGSVCAKLVWRDAMTSECKSRPVTDTACQ